MFDDRARLHVARSNHSVRRNSCVWKDISVVLLTKKQLLVRGELRRIPYCQNCLVIVFVPAEPIHDAACQIRIMLVSVRASLDKFWEDVLGILGPERCI